MAPLNPKVEDDATVGSSFSDDGLEFEDNMTAISLSLSCSSLMATYPLSATRKPLKSALNKSEGKLRISTESISSSIEAEEKIICSSQQNSFRRASNSVSFSNIEIREYDLTLGDHPSCSYGPPISLDWNYEVACNLNVDDYELHRGQRRNPRQMLINYNRRKNLLLWCSGHSESDLKTAIKEVNKVKKRRSTTKAFLPARKLEEVVESAGRKMRRAVVKEGKRKESGERLPTLTSFSF